MVSLDVVANIFQMLLPFGWWRWLWWWWWWWWVVKTISGTRKTQKTYIKNGGSKTYQHGISPKVTFFGNPDGVNESNGGFRCTWRQSWAMDRWSICRRGNGGICPKNHVNLRNYTPLRLTWKLKMNPWKRRFLLKTIIFRFHVSFREGKGLIRVGDGYQLGRSLYKNLYTSYKDS